MKTLLWRSCVVAAMVGLGWFGLATMACAQERNVPADRFDRMERLERRVNEMAERQEQFMHRVGAQQERGAPMAGPRGKNLRPPMAPPPDVPAAGPHDPRAAKLVKCICDTVGLLFLIGIICNVLLTIWIFTDIRKRGEGSGLFVALALVAGVPAAIIYALTRIGDKKV